MKRYFLAFIIIIYMALPVIGNVKHRIRVPLSFDYYYSYDMVVEALKKLHKVYPKLTKLEVIGKSDEGRKIYGMTINNPNTGNALSKPAIYVSGNIHGNELQATEVNLYLINYLLVNYNLNKEIKKLVDKKCFYSIPIVNVDGRYHFFKDGNTPSTNRGLRIPKDDDGDGLIDEDFPDDLDGDGNICMMRKKDSDGQWKTNPDDPRLMIRVKPGEKGEWILLGMEGIDNDGDGRVNEDSEGYVDPNRNWGFDWAPNYVQAGAGDYPFEGVGLKAISEWIMKKPNICMSWHFHNSGGMILRGPSTKTQGEYLYEDVKVYDFLGHNSERIIPGYKYMVSWKDLYTTYGDAGEWMAMTMGTYTFIGELFMVQNETFKSIKESKKARKFGDEADGMKRFMGNKKRDIERLKFNDNLAQNSLFKPWKPFKHPTYGNIEIGGWVKMSSRLPAPFMLKELVHRNASAVIFTAKHTPEISLKITEIKKIGSNLYRIRTKLENSKAIPTMTAEAKKNKIYPKDMLTLSGNNIKVVSGGLLLDKYRDKVAYKEYRPELQFFTIGSFGKIKHQFLVSGSGRVTIKYSSRHAGLIKKTITLK